MIIFILALVVMAVLVVKALIPIAIMLLLLTVGIAVVCVTFKDETDQNGKIVNRGAGRTIGVGCVFLIPGVVLWISSMNGYRALLSDALVLGEPRPGAVMLVFIGGVILIIGMIRKFREK